MPLGKQSSNIIREDLIETRKKWKKFGQAVNDSKGGINIMYIDKEITIENINEDKYNRVIFNGENWIFSGHLIDKFPDEDLLAISRLDQKTKNEKLPANIPKTKTFADKFMLSNDNMNSSSNNKDRTMYIRGFNTSHSREEIFDFLKEIIHEKFRLNLVNDNYNGNFRGIVFVNLETKKHMKELINQINGCKFDSQILYCKSSEEVSKIDMRD